MLAASSRSVRQLQGKGLSSMYTLEIIESAESDLDLITDYLGKTSGVVRVLRFFHESENYAQKL